MITCLFAPAAAVTSASRYPRKSTDDSRAVLAKLVSGIERAAEVADVDIEAVPELPLSRVASIWRKPVMPCAERTARRVARSFAESWPPQVGVLLVSGLDGICRGRTGPAPWFSFNQASDAGQAV